MCERRLLASVTSSGGGGRDELHAGAAAASEGGAAHPGTAAAAEAVPHIADSPSHAEVAPSSVSRPHSRSGHGCKKEKEKLSVSLGIGFAVQRHTRASIGSLRTFERLTDIHWDAVSSQPVRGQNTARSEDNKSFDSGRGKNRVRFLQTFGEKNNNSV